MSVPVLLLFLFEQRIECESVGTELVKMLGGGTVRQCVFATPFLATDDAQPLKIAHNGGIGLGQGPRIDT